MMQKISITAFLSEIDQNIEGQKPKIFSLQFVKAGKDENDIERGKIKKVDRCSKSFKYSSNQQSETATPKKTFYRIKEKGVLLLFNHDTSKNFTVIIDLVTHYNEMKIIR
jgi:hypothetical protein